MIEEYRITRTVRRLRVEGGSAYTLEEVTAGHGPTLDAAIQNLKLNERKTHETNPTIIKPLSPRRRHYGQRP